MKTEISYKKFTSQIIKCLFITVIKTVISNIIFTTINALFFHSGNDYSEIFPWYLKKILVGLTREKFILLGLLLVIFYTLTDYWESLWKEKIIIRINNYIKNNLLKKFRLLSLEKKLKTTKQISTLVEIESNNVSNYWVYYNTTICGSIVYTLLLLSSCFDSEAKFAWKTFFLAIFWFFLAGLITYLFFKLADKRGKKYKKALAKENALINKEIEKIVLVDSMGLTSQYEKNQQIITNKTKKTKIPFRKVAPLSKFIPNNLLINIFPFFLLLFLSKEFKELGGKSLNNIWLVVNNSVCAFVCLWDYGDYSSSLGRINSFLSLAEKEENLSGIKLTKQDKIRVIHFQNITFSYEGQSEPVLKKYYNRTFLLDQINYLWGENGSGKSTILYLLLGLLVPQEGQIILEDKKGKTYNLHQQINLKYWREQNIAYCAHDNLIEEGSTGQKQWVNIQKILKERKDSQIFCFDETDNALDQEKKEIFQGRLTQLMNQGKLVIYVKC